MAGMLFAEPKGDDDRMMAIAGRQIFNTFEDVIRFHHFGETTLECFLFCSCGSGPPEGSHHMIVRGWCKIRSIAVKDKRGKDWFNKYTSSMHYRV